MTIRVQHSFQGISGTAKDQFVNTFHFGGGGALAGTHAALATLIKNFYDVLPGGGGHPLSFYLSGNSDSPGARIKMYDLADPLPRVPIYDELYTPSVHPGAGQNLPNEVACCLSYAATHTAGVPIASQRGRIYIGPLNDNALGSASGDVISRPLLGMRTDMVKAAKVLQAAAADILWLWSVHSPTRAADYPITSFWSDDAWDTQRRRGEAPSSRYTELV